MDKIQLYSLATPNGQKVGVALEEMGLEYDAHKIDITKGDQFTPEFIAINPNSKIPAIVDPTGANGRPLSIMESGAILLHLAEKTSQFLSQDPKSRSQTIQWLFFQMGGAGPMFGQFGHFYKYAREKCDHPYPLQRYTQESRRLLTVIEKQLQDKEWIVGQEISIADMALAPWISCLGSFYEGGEILELDSYQNVNRWLASFLERPAVQRGMKVCGFD